MPALSSIVDSRLVKALLCAGDGNLFTAERTALAARTRVANAFLASFGARADYEPSRLAALARGPSFHAMALELAARGGIPLAADLLAAKGARAQGASEPPSGRALTAEALRRWVELEEVAVADYLSCALRPDAQTLDAVGRLASDYRIVCIALGGRGVLDACLLATRLDRFVAAECRYSVPDDGGEVEGLRPALYEQVCEQLGLGTGDVVAVEHTRAGVLAATRAGVRTIGNLHYVPARERGPRAVELAQAGAAVVVRSWSTVARLLRCLPFA